jgi:hypothetical protein
MMAPKFERLRVLGEAIQAAAYELDDPIDQVTVAGDRIVVAARGRRVELSYGYQNAYGENGSAMPGSGHWSVAIVHAEAKPSWAQAVLRKFGLFRKAR